jgi:hypothetical protein
LAGELNVRPHLHTPIVAWVAVFALGHDARAETASSALRLEREGRFSESAQAFERALSCDGNSRADLTTIHAHVALLRFANGDHDGAMESLLRLLEVDPNATLPDAAPPEMYELLREAADQWGGRRLGARVAPEVEGEGDEVRVRVLITVRDDLAGMVGGAKVLSGSREVARVRGRQPFEVRLSFPAPGDVEETYTVVLLDEHGGTLWSGEPFSFPSREEGDATAGVDRDSSRHRLLQISGWTLLGVGVGLVTVGGALVGIDSTPTGRTRRAPDGVLLEEQLDTIAGGGVLLGLGAAALVSSLVLLLVGTRQPVLHETALDIIDRGVWLGDGQGPWARGAAFEAMLDGHLE